MLDHISTHLLDVLQADARLIQGGSAYDPHRPEPAWRGVKRPANGDTPLPGWINLFDGPYEDSGTDHRPAIYLGMEALQATDREDFPAINSAGGARRVEYRALLLPLIVAVAMPNVTKWQAAKARSQLRNNIERILLDHCVESGFWYELRRPGQSGGGMAIERAWTSASQQPGGVSKAMCSLPLLIRYSFSRNSPA